MEYYKLHTLFAAFAFVSMISATMSLENGVSGGGGLDSAQTLPIQPQHFGEDEDEYNRKESF